MREVDNGKQDMKTSEQSAKYEKQHLLNVAKYQKAVETIFDKMCDEAAALGISTGWEDGKGDSFSFSKFPKARKKFTDLMWRVRKELEDMIQSGVVDEWKLADLKNEEVTKLLIDAAKDKLGLAANKLTDANTNPLMPRLLGGLAGFQERKVRGLGLSERVWNTTALASGQIELAIEQNLIAGKSAQKLSQDVRQCLKEPDMMYRRYHKKITLADGTKKDVRVWYRKRIGDDGKVHFVEEPLERVGQGVYRSSYKNAMRLARTETNMAYQKADSGYYKSSQIILGVEVILSNNHTTKKDDEVVPLKDICDELAGKYPADFTFVGWHPQCRCTTVPIMPKMSEMIEYLKKVANGEDVSNFKFSGMVTEMPSNYKQWIMDNEPRLIRMQRKGTLPYFVRENIAKGFKFGHGISFEDSLRWSGNEFEILDNGEVIMSQPGYKIEETSKPIVEQKRDILADDAAQYSKAMRANFADLEKAIGQRRGLSMSYEDADTCRENPNNPSILHIRTYMRDEKGNYIWEKKGRKMVAKKNPEYVKKEGYTINCQTCTLVHEMRRRGFNVEAIDNAKRRVWKIYEKNGVGSKREGYRIGKWLDESGKPVGPYYAKDWAQKNKGRSMRKKDIDEFMEACMRNDGRYEIYVDWKGGSAHVFLAEKKDGKITYFDPQSGKKDVWHGGYKDRCKPGEIGIVRIDNKLINPKLAESFVTLGELPIKTYNRHEQIMEIAAKRHEARPDGYKEHVKELLAERAKKIHRDEILARAAERHARRTEKEKKAIIDKRNAELTLYETMEKEIKAIDARAKRCDWLTDAEKLLYVGGAKGTKYHLYEYKAKAELLAKKIDFIDNMRPDWNLAMLHASEFPSYKDWGYKAKDKIIAMDEKGAKGVLSYMKDVVLIEPLYKDLHTYSLAHPAKKAGTKSKIEIALDDCVICIEKGDIAGAKARLADAAKTRDINEKSVAQKAAKKKAEEEAKRKAAEAAKNAQKKLSPNDATSLDDLRKIYGADLPKTLEELDDAIKKFSNVSRELVADRANIEKRMRELFQNSDFGMAVDHVLLESIFDKGFLNTFQVGSSKGYCGSSKTTGKIETKHGRLIAAHKMFNPSQHGKITAREFTGKQWDRKDYEKYGHTLDKDMLVAVKEQNVWYGDVQVRFDKDKVCPTWTYNDSLCLSYQPSLCCDPKVESFDRAFSSSTMLRDRDFRSIVDLRKRGGSSYVELQYHGDVGVDCVKSMVFQRGNPDTMVSKYVLKKWSDAGVDIYYYDSTKDKIVLYAKGKPKMTQAEAKQKFNDVAEYGEWLNDPKTYANKDIDFTSLSEHIKSGDYIEALNEAEKIQARMADIEARKKAMEDYIPDFDKWHKQFNVAEIEGAYKAISDKFKWLETKYDKRGDPNEVIGKLFREMANCEHPELRDPTKTRHSTWEIAHTAYKRKRNDLIRQYRGASIDDSIKKLKAFKTTDKGFKAKIGELDALVAQEEWGDVEDLIKQAMNDMSVLQQNNAEKILKLGECSRVLFKSDEFKQAKRDAARWFKAGGKTSAEIQKAYKEADDYMSKYAQEMWKGLTEEERHVLWLYTDGSNYINQEMIGQYCLRVRSIIDKSIRNGLDDANVLTSIIEKAPALKEDMWMQSGKSHDAFKAIFGVDIRSVGNLDRLVGVEGQNNLFMSCHASSDGYFVKGGNTGSSNDVVFNVFMPKGTKGAYMEPFASWGDDKRWKEGVKWTGTKRKCAPSDQVEFLLQRGARFRITKAYYDAKTGKWQIDIDLIEQAAQDALNTSIPYFDYRTIRDSRKPI